MLKSNNLNVNENSNDIKSIRKIEKLINIPIPIVDELDHHTLGAEYDGSSIIKLNLFNCSLFDIPKPIENLNKLITLDLSHNYIKSIPNFIGSLKSLESLDIRYNKIMKITDTISNLKLLNIIDLNNNKISILPTSIGNLKKLETLDLSYNKITHIPESFGELDSLQSLFLESNNLKDLPESFGNLKSLKELSIWKNKIEKLPVSFCNLKSLSRLNLKENQLKEIPDLFGNLKSLEALNLNHNMLKKLPKSFELLKETISHLFLNHNQFKTIPPEIWPFERLEKLYIKNNELLDDENKQILERDISTIREFCRRRATINVFISHAWADQELYRIIDFKESLENSDEINKVYICEKDLVGDIIKFMDEKVPQSNLLIFIATNNSKKSEACQHELALASTNNIEIIPIKGFDIENWSDLNSIELTKEKQVSINLGNLKGFEFNSKDFEKFCNELYDYIKQYKRDINLFDKEKAKIDKIQKKFDEKIYEFLESEDYLKIFNSNIEKFGDLLNSLENNKVSLSEFFSRYMKILNLE